MSRTTGVAESLAGWAERFEADDEDLALADRALLDTVSVGLAARDQPILSIVTSLPEVARWAVACHILDFDDLHLPSTTHISTVCVPAALASGGGPRAYLAGAGVMARLGTALGWEHYSRGWHATTTAGALGAAVTAAVAADAPADVIAAAMSLAVPAAGGVQRAFGTDAKSIQVGLAVDAGRRGAGLALAGATADPRAVDEWLRLLGGRPDRVEATDSARPAVPDGLAIKIYPCCYALQRPISALLEAGATSLDPAALRRIVVRTPAGTVAPLVHHRPQTGLEGKFSLEYAVAATLLDGQTGFASFTDEAVRRPAAQRLVQLVEVELSDGGDGLLSGRVEIELHSAGTSTVCDLRLPPGAPQRPPTGPELARKLEDCLSGTGLDPAAITWDSAAALLHHHLPPTAPATSSPTSPT
jgi:2-methylcitrate dehydratase PrpD